MVRRVLLFPLVSVGAVLLVGACSARNDSSTQTAFDFGASPPDGGAGPVGPGLDTDLGVGGSTTPVPDAAIVGPGGASGDGGDGGASGSGGSTGGVAPPPPDPDAGAGGVPAMGDPGPCANRAPDAHGACPATIYEVRKEIGLGNRVTVKGVVTSVRAGNGGAARNITLQIGTEQAEYFGPDFSAVWVYFGDATAAAEQIAAVQRGQMIELTGTTNDFYGQRQLTVIEAVTMDGPAQAVVPLPVEPAEVQTGGPRAEKLEAALIEVNDVSVTNAAPTPGDGDRDPTNEVEIGGGLRLDDFFYLLNPLPAANESFPRLDGILRLSNNLTKLEPRDAADVDRPHAPPPPPADAGVAPNPDSAVAPPADAGVAPPPVAGPLLISEVDYDQPSTDTAEFIEIYNPGANAVALGDLAVELVNGANSMVYRRFALSDAAPSLASHGFLVIGAQAIQASLPAGVPFIAFGAQPPLNQNIIQNGPDGLRIVDAAGTVIDGLAYEGAIAGTGEGNPADNDPGNDGGDSLSRCLNAPDHQDNATDFQVLVPTPGVTQSCP